MAILVDHGEKFECRAHGAHKEIIMQDGFGARIVLRPCQNAHWILEVIK